MLTVKLFNHNQVRLCSADTVETFLVRDDKGKEIPGYWEIVLDRGKEVFWVKNVVKKDMHMFDVAYIENEKGSTIHVVRPE